MIGLLSALTLSLTSQLVLPQQNPTDAIAPNHPVWSGALTCSTSTTVFFEFDSDGAGGAHSGYMLFPDKAIVTLQAVTGTGYASCFVTESPYTYLGATAESTFCDVDDLASAPNGDTVGSCKLLTQDTRASETFRLDHLAISKSGGARVGLCTSAVASRDRVPEGLSIYGQCLQTSECASQGGMGSGSTCTTNEVTINSQLNGFFSTKGTRGLYIGCRCSAAGIINATWWR